MSIGNNDITITLVKNTLVESGIYSTDVTYLCRSSRINKWSNFKPVSHPTLHPTLAQLPQVMKDANYGLAAVEMPQIVASALGGSSPTLQVPTPSEWQYSSPTGYAASPCRIGDFRGYDPTAKPFIYGSSVVEWFSGSQSIDNLLWMPNFKWGYQSHEGVGDTSFIRIVMTELNIANLDFATQQWRLGLAFPVGNNYLIASSEYCIKDITDTNSVNKGIVKLGLDYRTKAYLDGFKNATLTTLHPIPFIAYNLEFITTDPLGNYFKFMAGGRAFSFPLGTSDIPVTIHGGTSSTGLIITINSVTIEYTNVSYSVAVILGQTLPSGASSIRKPINANASDLKLTMEFTVNSNPSAISISGTNFTCGIAGNFMPPLGSVVSLGSNRYRVIGYESPQLPVKPSMNVLNNLPIYTGASGTYPSMSFSLAYNSYQCAQTNTVIKMTT